MSEGPEVRVGANGDALVPVLAGRRSFRPDALTWAVFVALASAVVALDRVTKDAVGDRLIYGSDQRLFGPLTLTHATNSGIAFGFFSSRTGAVASFGVVAVAAMIAFFTRVGGEDGRFGVVFGLLVGGTTGNLLDRLRFGNVTDFIELPFWPAFNLADVVIVVGALSLLVLLVTRDGRRPQPLLDPMEVR